MKCPECDGAKYTTVTIGGDGYGGRCCGTMDCDDQPCVDCNATGLDCTGFAWYRFEIRSAPGPGIHAAPVLYRFTKEPETFKAKLAQFLTVHLGDDRIQSRRIRNLEDIYNLTGRHPMWRASDGHHYPKDPE